MKTKNNLGILSHLSILLTLALAWCGTGTAQVHEAWVARYNGPGNHLDRAFAITVDRAGNVYVTGASNGTNATVAFATVKYDGSGNQLWVARYEGPLSESSPSAIALDSDGNVYVTGGTHVVPAGEAYATAKYDAQGDELWTARYESPDGFSVRASGVAVDRDGSVYITGTGGTVKYDAAGNQLWAVSIAAVAIAIESEKNVIVTGSADSDFLIAKYDTNGSQIWAARYNGPGTGYDGATRIALDSTGNVYVCGESLGAAGFLDYATVKYSATGNQIWVARYGDDNNGHDTPRGLAVDGAGNVWVTGSSGSPGPYATVKYDSAGHELWVARYNSPSNSDQFASAIALDATGCIYVTGSDGDYLTITYDPDGNQRWVVRYAGPSGFGDYASGIAADSAGNVYVTGWSDGDRVSDDFATVKYVQGLPIATRLTAPAFLPRGQFQFTLLGEAGRGYEIQASIDLAAWTVVTNFVSVTGTNLVSDLLGSRLRFYRAIRQP